MADLRGTRLADVPGALNHTGQLEAIYRERGVAWLADWLASHHRLRAMVLGERGDRVGALAMLDEAGEKRVAVAQRDAIYAATGDAEAAEAVWADVWGQFLYERRHGRFPDDQAAFVKTWLERGEAAALEGVF